MSERRARNIISRTLELSLRAADLLDDGLGDAEVAAALNDEFAAWRKKKHGGKAISSGTVASFRLADYEQIRSEREARVRARNETMLVMGAARGSASDFAEASQNILAKMYYDIIREVELDQSPDKMKSLNSIARTLAKIREIEISKVKVELERQRESAAQRIKEAVSSKTMSQEDLVKEVDRIMGLGQ